jgi:hypothetical protein
VRFPPHPGLVIPNKLLILNMLYFLLFGSVSSRHDCMSRIPIPTKRAFRSLQIPASPSQRGAHLPKLKTKVAKKRRGLAVAPAPCRRPSARVRVGRVLETFSGLPLRIALSVNEGTVRSAPRPLANAQGYPEGSFPRVRMSKRQKPSRTRISTRVGRTPRYATILRI